MNSPCEHRGHCWHLADGSLYERHSGNAPGSTARVTCCDCPGTAILPLYSKHTQRSLVGPTRRQHGPNLPKPDFTPTPEAA